MSRLKVKRTVGVNLVRKLFRYRGGGSLTWKPWNGARWTTIEACHPLDTCIVEPAPRRLIVAVQ